MNVPVKTWKLKDFSLDLSDGPVLMGIVNVTPDSFSDGGKFFEASAAVEHGLRLAEEGAGILDVGGESTRPYSASIADEEELNRVVPVIERLAASTSIPVSVDTSKASVARVAVEAGAQIINDVSGFRDPDMVRVARETGAGLCVMHMQGTPQTMQDSPAYESVVDDVLKYLLQQKAMLIDEGIEGERICIDPGIGFGKTSQHNFELVRNVDCFHRAGCPVLVGHSRKGFIGKAIGDMEASRTSGTLAITLHLAKKSVQVIRVHEIEPAIQAIRVLKAIDFEQGDWPA